MKVYLAGPMSGLPHFNYPAFNAAAATLRAEGCEVFNPAENDIATYGCDISNVFGSVAQAAAEHGFDRRAALKVDLAWICDHADAIALLPGWERSSGARAERALAAALGIRAIMLGREVDPCDQPPEGRASDRTPDPTGRPCRVAAGAQSEESATVAAGDDPAREEKT